MWVVIRADGGPEIGYGHLVRTGALAEAVLERGHDVTCATTTPEIARSVHPDPVTVLSLDPDDERETFPAWVRDEQPEVVLTDSYEIDTPYQRALTSTTRPLVVVLDDTRHTICADVLVNGNVYAPELDYDYEGEEPEWCLGLDYLLLREAISTRASGDAPWRSPPERALVTMGGSDIRGTTPDVLPAFEGTDLTVDVIVGPGFDDGTTRQTERVAAEVEADIRVTRDPPDFAERMFQADLAVSATGSTSYELLALGTPTIGIPQADNQLPIAEALADRGAMVHLPAARLDGLGETLSGLVADTDRRRSLRQRGEALVDGRGTDRVCDVLIEGIQGGQ
jgi:UDP-2,4-diacetamido-2,4,6-trideoxy-beta-L-altropyranose hydrolase